MAGDAGWPPGEGEMARLVRAKDWGATPLGPAAGWSERLKAAVELMLASPQVATLAVGPGRVLLYNDAAARLYGGRHPGLLGRPLAEAFPESYPSVAALYDRAFAGESVEVPARAVAVSEPGGEVWEAALLPLGDGRGAVAAVQMTGVEVGARLRAEAGLRESEARQAFLLGLSDALRPLGDPAEILASVSERVGRHFRAGRCGYAEATGPHAVIARDWTDGRMASGRGGWPLDGFGGGFVEQYRAGETVVIHDALADARARGVGAEFEAIGGVRSAISVPLVKRGELVAAFYVQDTSPRVWAQADVALMQDIAERTWAAVERARAEAARRESETRFRALVTAGTQMIYRMSPDWTEMIQLDGQGLLVDTGAPFADWMDTYLLPEDRPAILAAVAEAIRTRSLFDMEHRVRTAEGGVGWVVSRAVPMLGEDGGIVEWFGTGSDVTARHEAEARLRAAEARHRADLEGQVEARTADLQASRDLLQAAMDSSLDMIQVFEAVRDERGGIVDFRWVLNNHTSESRYGRIEGESLLERNPGVLVEGIFDAFRRVTETGLPEQAERRYAHEQFDGWFLQSVVRLNDGVATTTKEITGWKAAQEEVLRLTEEVAQARLRESEERFRVIVETATDYAILTTDPEGRIETWSPGAAAVFGWTAEEVLGRPLDIAFTPEDRAAGAPGEERRTAREAGQASSLRWHLRKGGARVLFEGAVRPLLGPDGRPRGFVKVGQDVTERQATEDALRKSETRFRTLAEGIPQLVWRARDGGRWTWASPQWTAFTGQPDEASHGWGWLEPLHPDDREGARAAWERLGAADAFEADYRVREAATGDYRWFQTRATPVRDRAGEVVEWLGTSTDVQDLREMQERQAVLLAELQHRTRNLLGVVRSTMSTTLRGRTTLDEFVPSFRDRLDALTRVNGLLSRLQEDDRIAFDELIRAELGALGALDAQGCGERVTLDGPKGVRLRSSTVQTLALALHELATNAVKYGALRQPGGRLTVSWSRTRGGGEGGADEPRLRVEWTETGVAMPEPGAAAQGSGFGRELIERALPYQLKAETTYELTPVGVRCTITLPLSSTEERTRD